ncbi:MAG TPA: DUF2268 domain-containing putative Zn-dependent protease [Pseudidiomarina sp.]|nr:DUF2268 domain-containing putative Zn-dependent protease [Pseudidiomarina sp.]
MMKLQVMGLLVCVGVVTGCVPQASSSESVYVLDDVKRFAALIETAEHQPTEQDIDNFYLKPGSRGVEIFTPHRIKDAHNLHQHLLANRKYYDRAATLCLPAAESIQAEATAVLERAAMLLQQDEVAPIYVVMGAFNSGGTASSDGLVLGLEVICNQVQTAAEARELIAAFVAHEIVHVYQIRNVSRQMASAPTTVLSQSLVEGFADYIAERLQGQLSSAERERYQYVVEHEQALWNEFKTQLDSETLQPWMYAGDVNGRPADLGYSIGKRIVAAYVANADNETDALQELLSFSDPHEILRKSGYGLAF